MMPSYEPPRFERSRLEAWPARPTQALEERLENAMACLAQLETHEKATGVIARPSPPRDGGLAGNPGGGAPTHQLHQAELDGVHELLASGALDRVRRATRQGPQNDPFAPSSQATPAEFTRSLVL